MKVSVVVPNHGRDLSKLKASINGSAELIVIDRGMERSQQRNIGIREATGDIILWLDSDQSVSPGLISELQELFQYGITAVFVPEIIVGSSLFARIRAFEREFYTGTAIDVPRAILKRVMPFFDETLHGPEDADMGQRIPGIRAVSRNPLYHHDDISFLEYCRKKAYYTKSMARYAEKWPNDPCLNIKYRCWTVFTEKGKWRKLLCHPFLTIGIIFLLITRAVIFYANR
jgi:glycosyltransferase involved in cell wall biosynthesis